MLRVVAILAEGGIEVAHGSGSFNIGLFFSRFEGETNAIHEVEVAQLDLLGQFFQREADEFVSLWVVMQVIQRNMRKVADDDVARHVLQIVTADFFDIFQRLKIGSFKVFSGGFVLAQQAPCPEHVGKLGTTLAMAHSVFGGGGFIAIKLEDGKKLVPEGVFFGTLAGFALEAFGKGLRQTVFVLVGIGSHAVSLAKGDIQAGMASMQFR